MVEPYYVELEQVLLIIGIKRIMLKKINNTTYSTVLDNTDIIIGGNSKKFIPNINFSKWDNEV